MFYWPHLLPLIRLLFFCLFLVRQPKKWFWVLHSVSHGLQETRHCRFYSFFRFVLAGRTEKEANSCNTKLKLEQWIVSPFLYGQDSCLYLNKSGNHLEIQQNTVSNFNVTFFKCDAFTIWENGDSVKWGGKRLAALKKRQAMFSRRQAERQMRHPSVPLRSI